MRHLIITLLFVFTGSLASAQKSKCQKLPLRSGEFDFKEYIDILARPVPECDRTAHIEIPCLKRDVRARLNEASASFSFDHMVGTKFYIYEYCVGADGMLDKIFFYDKAGLSELQSIHSFLSDMGPIPRKKLVGDPATHHLASFGVVDYFIVEDGKLIIPADGGL